MTGRGKVAGAAPGNCAICGAGMAELTRDGLCAECYADPEVAERRAKRRGEQMALRERARRLRTQKGMGAEEVAQALGVTPRTVYRWLAE